MMTQSGGSLTYRSFRWVTTVAVFGGILVFVPLIATMAISLSGQGSHGTRASLGARLVPPILLVIGSLVFARLARCRLIIRDETLTSIGFIRSHTVALRDITLIQVQDPRYTYAPRRLLLRVFTAHENFAVLPTTVPNFHAERSLQAPVSLLNFKGIWVPQLSMMFKDDVLANRPPEWGELADTTPPNRPSSTTAEAALPEFEVNLDALKGLYSDDDKPT